MFETRDHRALVIRSGRIIDPFLNRDGVADLALADGVIVADPPAGAEELDASGWIISPGLIDMHVHLREPGQTHKETIATGTAAAAAGGFTAVACMPNTTPPLDSPEAVRFVIEQARSAGQCEVWPIAAVTKARQGSALSDFEALRDAGAAAFSDDGTGVEDDAVMRAAFIRARDLDVVLIQHCEYRRLSAGGVMHLGDVSHRLGLPGLDPRSEEAMIDRDIGLCRRTRGRYHVAHISTARAVEMVRRAKADGVPVTAEVTPHHLLLTHEACETRDPNTKMHPPLRTNDDVDACRRGLVDGTIDCIATDHAPHAAEEKARGFVQAPPGIIGLETAIGLVARSMIEPGIADWPDLIRWFSAGPAGVLKRDRPTTAIGQSANLTLIAASDAWEVNPERLLSKSRNTPFAGWRLIGRPVGTVRGTHVTVQKHP
jgi:dihydroorotase